MVKGVSKTVIVVNDTGSKFFEKIVFYVTPEYGTLNAKQLKKAASAFSFHYSEYGNSKPLRQRIRRRKRLKCIAWIGGGLAAAAVLLWILL